ncbi:MAG: glycerate kinase type-2 family protein, partial [Candidatus Binatia bacterium]
GMTRTNQAFLTGIFRAAVGAVDPEELVFRHLATVEGAPVLVRGGRVLLRLDDGGIWLVAAGKAAAGMALAAVDLVGDRLEGGVVVAPEVSEGLPKIVRCYRGGHPLPDRSSHAAGRATWEMIGRARAPDTVLVLLSGGASSLLALPAAGIRLRDKVRVTGLLLRAGARIAEVNAVRKHLSRLKGGGLARRAGRARVVCLLLSDVIGSSPAVIGSGPAAADPSTFADACEVLRRYDIEERVPPAVRRHLERGRSGAIRETLKPGEGGARHVILGDVRAALAAASAEARRLGAEPRILTASLHGDTDLAARRFAAEVLRCAVRARHDVCLLAGGETTVDVRGPGRGGRNQQFAMVVAREISGAKGI